MPPKKKARQEKLTNFFQQPSTSPSPLSDYDDPAFEANQRRFLERWRFSFPWAEMSDDEKVYCHDCRRAGFNNEFVMGKVRPRKGWKKEYLQRHVVSKDHARHANLAISTDFY